jgi:UDP-glucose 4-epimerase
MTAKEAERPLVVAITGPTGEIGRPFVRLLDRTPQIGRIRAMARRPLDPRAQGWRRVEYIQGDVLDQAAVGRLVAGADVVVHLAFAIFGRHQETRLVNLEGSRNIFRAATHWGVRRLVYTSSVAAYGFHPDHPQPLTEEVVARGSRHFYYSAHKAELEHALQEIVAGHSVDAWVFRPCVVGGPESTALVDNLPYVQISRRLPSAVREALDHLPALAPVLPDFGVPLQLVHADDVALALRAGVLGRGEPGPYNLAAPGQITISDLAAELGWHAVHLPGIAAGAVTALVNRLPRTPARAEWIHALLTPVLMDTTRARRVLHWRPRHDAQSILRQTVAACRGR